MASYEMQAQTETKERPPDRFKGTSPFTATLTFEGLLPKPPTEAALKKAVLPKAHTEAPKPASVIVITKSDIRINCDVGNSVVSSSLKNEGTIVYEIEAGECKEVDDESMENNSGVVPNAGLNTGVTKSVVSCNLYTNGIKFTTRGR